MTEPRDDHSLSRIEILTLARLATSKPPTEQALVDIVFELAIPDESPARAREIVAESLASLRERGLVDERRRKLTEEGRRALRTVLDLVRAPTWREVIEKHLPALGLGLEPGMELVNKTLKDTESVTAAVLRDHYELPDAPTSVAICDALLAEALGMPPGKITLGRLRTHVLARRAGVEAKGEPVQLAARIAAGAVGARRADRRSLTRALARRWLNDADGAEIVAPPPAPPAPPAPPTQPAQPASLLDVVRDTIPRVGTAGRYGSEKVFVSAIWHSMESERRPADLSLDRFKRWLLTANRDGWLVLARADLVGAMDAKLVAESEIEDQGATFHFVLDPRSTAQRAERGTHAR